MQQRSTRYTRWLVTAMGGALLLSNAACDDKNFNTLAILATGVTVASASQDQVGVVGQPLPEPIIVHVSDPDGNSVSNAVVTWTVLTGGGTVSAPTSLTDANGNASVTWTLGPVPGANSLRASIANGASAIINATGVAANATALLTKTSGDLQTITVGSTSAPMVVTLTDIATGNPIAGATVSFATSAGTISATSVTTDAAGVASVTQTANAGQGVYTITASAPGANPVQFTLNATP